MENNGTDRRGFKMKLRTKSYQITHLNYNVKLSTPAHLRPAKKLPLSDKLGIAVIIFATLYFAIGILFPRDYSPSKGYSEHRRESQK